MLNIIRDLAFYQPNLDNEEKKCSTHNFVFCVTSMECGWQESGETGLLPVPYWIGQAWADSEGLEVFDGDGDGGGKTRRGASEEIAGESRSEPDSRRACLTLADWQLGIENRVALRPVHSFADCAIMKILENEANSDFWLPEEILSSCNSGTYPWDLTPALFVHITCGSITYVCMYMLFKMLWSWIVHFIDGKCRGMKLHSAQKLNIKCENWIPIELRGSTGTRVEIIIPSAT